MTESKNLKERSEAMVDLAIKSAEGYALCLDTQNRTKYLFSHSNLERRATVKSFKSKSPENLKNQLQKYITKQTHLSNRNTFKCMKLEIIVEYKKYSKRDFHELLNTTRRNHFYHGIGFDKEMDDVITKGEIEGWCLLFSNQNTTCTIREDNFANYFNKTKKKNQSNNLRNSDDIYLFSTISAYSNQQQNGITVKNKSLNDLREEFAYPKLSVFKRAISQSIDYLANQIDSNGKYTYGRWPCFDKKISTYNMLMHFSTTYALIEGLEISCNPSHINAVLRAIQWGIDYGFYRRTINGEELVFLKEDNDELKLGGSALAIIAISRYTLTKKDQQFVNYLPSLVRGLLYFRVSDGQLSHALESPSLTTKDKFRTIYYDGQALYALLIAYQVTKESAYLSIAQELADLYINTEYNQHNDHWQAIAFSELYSITKEPKYISFLIANVKHYTNTIKNQINTSAYLLELSASTYESFEQADKAGILDQSFNLEAFIEAMVQRGEYLLNGLFVPEHAMHFKKPNSVINSFFIQHQGFRTRIDDNAHNLLGLSRFYHLLRRNLLSFDSEFFRNRDYTIDDLRVIKLFPKKNKSLVGQLRTHQSAPISNQDSNIIIKITRHKKLPFMIYDHLSKQTTGVFQDFKFAMPQVKCIKHLEKRIYTESDWLTYEKATVNNTFKYANSELFVNGVADFNAYFTCSINDPFLQKTIQEKPLSITYENLNCLFLDTYTSKHINYLYDTIYELFNKLTKLTIQYVDTNSSCICHNDLVPSNVGIMQSPSESKEKSLAIIDIDNAIKGNWGQDLRFLISENINEGNIQLHHRGACKQYVNHLNKKGIKVSEEHVFYASVFAFANKNFNFQKKRPYRQKPRLLIDSINTVMSLLN